MKNPATACMTVPRFLISWLVLTAFVAAPSPVRGQEPPRYDIRAVLDTERKQIKLEQTVVFTNPGQKEIRELVFHIYPNRHYSPQEKQFMLRYGGYFKVNPFLEELPAEGMRIQSLLVDGRERDYRVEGADRTLLKIPLDQPVSPGDSVSINIQTEVLLPHMYGRFGWHRNIIKLSHWYPVLSVYDDEGWHEYPFYPFHRPFFSAAALYTVSLTMPKEYVPIHTGVMAGEESLDEVFKTVKFETKLPVRDFTLALSPDYQVMERTWGNILLKSYYLPGDNRAAQRALDDAQDLMEFYTARFGEYPYSQFSIAPVHLGYGGEQMSNMAFIDTRVYKLPEFLHRYFDFLIAHETGHQWFYNLVGIDEYTQMWLEEGVNSFFISEYLEDKYGRDANIVDYPDWLSAGDWIVPRLTFERTRDFRYKILARIGYDHKVVDKLWGFREPTTIFSLTYGKGARIVQMLRHYLGEEKFAQVFNEIFNRYRYANLDVQDLITLSEEQYGDSLDWFFDPWLYSSKRFDYAVNNVRGQIIDFENRGSIRMPVDVRVRFDDGNEDVLTWDGESDQVTIDDSRRIVQVVIDPEEQVLDIDRTNNVWPRKVYVQPVPVYLGLYEVPVFLKDDGYHLIVGPETAHSGFGLKASFQKPYDYILYGASDYEFGERLWHSRTGFKWLNVFKSQTSLGFELLNTDDRDGDEDDVLSGKVYLRRELWPAQYGLLDMNDHLTLYVLRNHRLGSKIDSTSLAEDDRNIDYSRRDESIIGTELHIDRSGPYPNPLTGYQLTALAEHAGHFWGADQSFTRTSLDASFYQRIIGETVLATRLKYGWGFPNDKALYHLGGMHGLRGYKRKTVRGANIWLGSLELRFPLVPGLDQHFFDNVLGLESLSGVVFMDAGQAWFSDFSETNIKADAGLGLRLTVNIGSFLEKLVIRADVAQSINDTDEGVRFWLGVNQAF